MLATCGRGRAKTATCAGYWSGNSNQSQSARRRQDFGGGLFGNAVVSKAAERRMTIYESDGIDALRRIDADWPLDLPTKAKIGALVAVHMVRNPAVLRNDLAASQQADHRKAAAV